MENEITLNGLSGNVEALTGRVDTLAGNVESLTGRVDVMAIKLDVVTTRLDDVTTGLDVVTTRLDDVTTRLDVVTTRLDDVITTVDDLAELLTGFATRTESDIRELKNGQERIETRLNRVESSMVTKAYLDDKLFDKENDFGVALRTEDKKLNTVVSKLEEKKVFNKQEAANITELSPFAVPST